MAREGTAILDFRSDSGLFSVAPNASVTLRGLHITGAALPETYPLAASSFLALRAFSLPKPASSPAAPQLRLEDVTIVTPSCRALALHQDLACRASPSPNFTVMSNGLHVISYSTPAVRASNVTLTCSGALLPSPCNAFVVNSTGEFFGALRAASLQSSATETSGSTDNIPTFYVFLNRSVSVRDEGLEPADEHSPAAKAAATWPVLIDTVRLVIAGATNPSQPAGASGALESSTTTLDLAGRALLLKVSMSARVELHNLTLANPPVGPLTSLSQPPQGLLTLLLWTFNLPRALFGNVKSYWRLYGRGLALELAPEELALWHADLTGRVPTELAGCLCAVRDGLMDTEPLGSNQKEPPLGALAATPLPGGGLFVPYLRTKTVGLLLFEALLLRPSTAGDLCDSRASYSARAAFAASTRPFSPSMGPPPYPPPPRAPLSSVLAQLPPALPPLCQLQAPGDPRPAQVELVKWFTGRLSPIIVTSSGSLESSVLTNMVAGDSWFHVKSSAGVLPDLPHETFAITQAQVVGPELWLGNPMGPRLLHLSHAAATVNVRRANASLALRQLVLAGLAPAALHPSSPALLTTSPKSGSAGSAGSAATDTAAAAAAKPPAPPPPTPSARRQQLVGSDGVRTAITGPVAKGSREAERQRRAQTIIITVNGTNAVAIVGPPAGVDATGGLPAGMANFTSCLWALDFDRPPPPTRMPAASLLDGPQPPPRAFLDSVVMLVPAQELALMSAVWAERLAAAAEEVPVGAAASALFALRAYDNSATAAAADVSDQLAAFVGASRLVAGVTSGSLQRLTVRLLAMHAQQGAASARGGSNSASTVDSRNAGGSNSTSTSSAGVGTDSGSGAEALETEDPWAALAFESLSWCGLAGFNVTLAAELPPSWGNVSGQSAWQDLWRTEPLQLPLEVVGKATGQGHSSPDEAPVANSSTPPVSPSADHPPSPLAQSPSSAPPALPATADQATDQGQVVYVESSTSTATRISVPILVAACVAAICTVSCACGVLLWCTVCRRRQGDQVAAGGSKGAQRFDRCATATRELNSSSNSSGAGGDGVWTGLKYGMAFGRGIIIKGCKYIVAMSSRTPATNDPSALTAGSRCLSPVIVSGRGAENSPKSNDTVRRTNAVALRDKAVLPDRSPAQAALSAEAPPRAPHCIAKHGWRSQDQSHGSECGGGAFSAAGRGASALAPSPGSSVRSHASWRRPRVLSGKAAAGLAVLYSEMDRLRQEVAEAETEAGRTAPWLVPSVAFSGGSRLLTGQERATAEDSGSAEAKGSIDGDSGGAKLLLQRASAGTSNGSLPSSFGLISSSSYVDAGGAGSGAAANGSRRCLKGLLVALPLDVAGGVDQQPPFSCASAVAGSTEAGGCALAAAPTSLEDSAHASAASGHSAGQTSAFTGPDSSSGGGGRSGGGRGRGSSAHGLVLLGELARGAQGVVFHGLWKGLDAAVKSVTFQQCGSDPRVSRPAQEAAIAASLSHPHVVATYAHELHRITPDDGPSSGTPASVAQAGCCGGTGVEAAVWRLTLVQELCDGGTLRDCLDSGRLAGCRLSSAPPPPPRRQLPPWGSGLRQLPRPPAAPRASSTARGQLWAALELPPPPVAAGDPVWGPVARPPTSATCMGGAAAGSAVNHPDVWTPAAPANRGNNVLLGGAAATGAVPPAQAQARNPRPRLLGGIAEQVQPARSCRGDRGERSLGCATSAPSAAALATTVAERPETTAREALAVQPAPAIDAQGPPALIRAAPPVPPPAPAAAVSPGVALLVALQVARGVAYLHSLGVLHGDLSSANVLLRSGGDDCNPLLSTGAAAAPPPVPPLQQQHQHKWPESSAAAPAAASAAGCCWVACRGARLSCGFVAKVCDFGLSDRLEGSESHISGEARRSLLYSAPELVQYGTASKASDVYAFAVLMHEIACGASLPVLLRDAARGGGLRSWLAAQEAPGAAAAALPAGLLVWPAGLPTRAVELAAECLAERPEERPGFEAICERLEAALSAVAPALR